MPLVGNWKTGYFALRHIIQHGVSYGYRMDKTISTSDRPFCSRPYWSDSKFDPKGKASGPEAT